MSFQVTLNSRNVLVPLSLEDHQGERMLGALSRLDTATAMVIQVSASGSFTQEFVPLRIRQETTRGYAGGEWELWVQKASGDLHVYYLGIPDGFFATGSSGEPPRSLSIEVVGTSPLSGREEFTGGVDVTLQAQVEPPLIPGFLGLAERFFPTLLPHNFIDRHVAAEFEFGGKRSLLLLVSLQMDEADRVPVSLGKHWDAKNWIQAVVENLAPVPASDSGEKAAWFAIQGGCFYGRNGKLSHWFGGGIGLEEKGFRQAATERIRTLGEGGTGAWIFWLEPQGAADGVYELMRNPAAAARRRISIRHPMLQRLLAPAAALAKAEAGQPTLAEELPVGEAVAALAQVAGILIRHQDTLQRALAEPTHAAWSERANPAAAALLALEGRPESLPAAPGSQDGLASDIRDLYATRGETLRALEALFDETFGYSAWDAVGNPMRDLLSGFLSGQDAKSKSAESRASA